MQKSVIDANVIVSSRSPLLNDNHVDDVDVDVDVDASASRSDEKMKKKLNNVNMKNNKKRNNQKKKKKKKNDHRDDDDDDNDNDDDEDGEDDYRHDGDDRCYDSNNINNNDNIPNNRKSSLNSSPSFIRDYELETHTLVCTRIGLALQYACAVVLFFATILPLFIVQSRQATSVIQLQKAPTYPSDCLSVDLLNGMYSSPLTPSSAPSGDLWPSSLTDDFPGADSGFNETMIHVMPTVESDGLTLSSATFIVLLTPTPYLGLSHLTRTFEDRLGTNITQRLLCTPDALNRTRITAHAATSDAESDLAAPFGFVDYQLNFVWGLVTARLLISSDSCYAIAKYYIQLAKQGKGPYPASYLNYFEDATCVRSANLVQVRTLNFTRALWDTMRVSSLLETIEAAFALKRCEQIVYPNFLPTLLSSLSIAALVFSYTLFLLFHGSRTFARARNFCLRWSLIKDSHAPLITKIGMVHKNVMTLTRTMTPNRSQASPHGRGENE